MTQDALENQPPSQIQTAGNVTVSGNENAFALVTAAGNAAIDQSRHIIYNYYYREETSAVPVESTVSTDDLLCPYRGLFHFGPNDAAFFFGREVFVTELLQAVQTRAFVPVLGASGSGKSSVVLAGLVPKLQLGHWQFTHFRPGAEPFHALASALVPLYTPALDATEQMRQARKLASYFQDGSLPLGDVIDKIQRNYPNQRVLLIADQFEELYTLCTQEATRRGFLDCLLASLSTAKASTLVLVATMRADFLGNALSYRPFADVLQAGDVKLGAMNREELCQVIEQPAAMLGVTFEAGLSKRILDAVINEPGNLPLLEFALTELWSRRNGRQLTHAAYEAIGEVEGALARYADEQYARLSESEQAQVRRIFVQLVRPGEGAEDTRRLATKAELGEERWGLVNQLANSRLVVTSQDGVKQETVEVVHEALIRNWGELRGWMTADRTFRVWQDRLRGAMQQWEATNHDDGALLRGAALVEAQERLQKRREDLSLDEQGFIQASLTLQQQERQQQERRRKLTLLGLTSFSTIALGLAGMAGWAWRQSEIAQIETLMKASRLLLSSDQSFDAIIASLQASKKLQGPVTRDASRQTQVSATLQQALTTVKEQNRFKGFKGAVRKAIVSPNGTIIATADKDAFKLWRKDGTLQATLDGSTDKDYRVTMGFSQDGQTIATFDGGGWISPKPIKVWGLDGTVRSSSWGQTRFKQVQFSPDRRTVATFDGTIVQLWQFDGTAIASLSGSDAKHSSVVFSSDGQIVISTAASADPDRQIVKFWQRNGTPISTFTAEKKFYPKALNHDGSRVIMSDGKTLKLQQGNGHIVAALADSAVPETYINDVLVSPDSQTIAASYNDNNSNSGKGMVKLWRADGRWRATLSGHEQSISEMTFSPDSQRIATASRDKTVKIWDLNGTLRTTLVGHGDHVNTIVFSPADSQMLASSSDDGTLRLWEINDPSPLQRQEFASVVFSEDETVFATAIKHGSVAVWKMDGTPSATLISKSNDWVDIRLSQDGKTIMTVFYDSGSYGPVALWNDNGTRIKTLMERTPKRRNSSGRPFVQPFLSNDGKTIVTNILGSNFYGPIELWNGDGTHIKTLINKTPGPKGPSWGPMAFLSNDGKTIVTSVFGSDSDSYGPVELWNDDGTHIKTLINKTPTPKSPSWAFDNAIFSRDGKAVVTNLMIPNSRGPAKLWDAKGMLRTTLFEATESSQTKTSDVQFSEDGQTLLTNVNGTDSHSVVKLWRSDGSPLKTLIDAPNITGSIIVTFSHSGYPVGTITAPETIITAVPGGAISQWSADGTLLHTVMEKTKTDQPVSKLILSPDGQILAVQVNDKEIQLWDINGKLLQTINNEGAIGSSAFSPDSKLFAAGSNDNTVKLWNRQANWVIPLVSHTSGVDQLHFDPASKYLASVSETGKVILLPLDHLDDLQFWIKRGCSKVRNYLEHTPNLSEDDKHICDGVASEAG